jgi:hypothetical protein
MRTRCATSKVTTNSSLNCTDPSLHLLILYMAFNFFPLLRLIVPYPVHDLSAGLFYSRIHTGCRSLSTSNRSIARPLTSRVSTANPCPLWDSKPRSRSIGGLRKSLFLLHGHVVNHISKQKYLPHWLSIWLNLTSKPFLKTRLKIHNNYHKTQLLNPEPVVSFNIYKFLDFVYWAVAWYVVTNIS